MGRRAHYGTNEAQLQSSRGQAQLSAGRDSILSPFLLRYISYIITQCWFAAWPLPSSQMADGPRISRGRTTVIATTTFQVVMLQIPRMNLPTLHRNKELLYIKSGEMSGASCSCSPILLSVPHLQESGGCELIMSFSVLHSMCQQASTDSPFC